MSRQGVERYLDAQYSRCLSTDPALGAYVPQAPINDDAKKHNQNLPGMGGVFNTVNMNLYHYASNNPIKYTDPTGMYSWQQFKDDLSFAFKTDFNFDFGLDWTQYAAQAWDNGDYLNFAVCEINATLEMGMDLIACYGGAKAVSATIKAGIMLKTTLSALSSSETVVLGRYAEGSCGGYTKMADKIGASYFQLPSKIFNILEKVKIGDSNLGKIINEKWLDGVINSGARILLNYNPEKAPAGSAYAMEVQKLAEKGFEFIKTTVKGIECWEAVK